MKRLARWFFLINGALLLFAGGAGWLVTTPAERLMHSGVWMESMAYLFWGGLFFALGLMIKPKAKPAPETTAHTGN